MSGSMSRGTAMSMKKMGRLRRCRMTSFMSRARMMAVGEPVELMTMSVSRRA